MSEAIAEIPQRVPPSVISAGGFDKAMFLAAVSMVLRG